MSVAYDIKLTGSQETQRKLETLWSVPGLNERVGESVASMVRAHLVRLDGERANALGGKRSHFYREAAKGTSSRATAQGAEVTIEKLGLRQRLYGGTIHAINSKYLTVPARKESYGVPAREFPGDLKFVQFKSGAKALVLDDQTHAVDEAGNYATHSRKKSKKKSVGMVMYWLVPSVYQRPDPSVLPSESAIAGAAERAADRHLKGFLV